MNIGTLRHRLTLESPSETTGDAVVSWSTMDTVWGQVEGLGGVEGNALIAEAAYRFRIRYRADVTPKMRLGLSGTSRKFGIVSVVDPDGRQRELEIMAQELL